MVAIGDARFGYWDGGLPSGIHTAGTDWLFCQFVSTTEPVYPARHGKNYNVLFCDGHVSSMDPAIFFNPTNNASMWNNDHQPHIETWGAR
jgi:prepilin-type processing-associated H-X9-DG protein